MENTHISQLDSLLIKAEAVAELNDLILCDIFGWNNQEIEQEYFKLMENKDNI